ncbi:SMI1/KNR4 family protein [Helicobacter mehlei]|uniref:SMI1/KNR4 family protein n=1 Tax=Helicobacter mehlei TaxID=2316080 RepID=A0A553UZU6_9HELI|nr:SMI1/KNR4 family protein [Helicobacter mehlei]
MATNGNTTQGLSWDFAIPLQEEGLQAAQDFSKQEFSPTFIDFLRRNNNAIPPKHSFSIGNKNYSFKNVLDFNTEGKCLFVFFMESLKEHLGQSEIVFGSDGYGGYYLLDTSNQQVLFLDTDTYTKTPLLVWDMFMKKLEG